MAVAYGEGAISAWGWRKNVLTCRRRRGRRFVDAVVERLWKQERRLEVEVFNVNSK